MLCEHGEQGACPTSADDSSRRVQLTFATGRSWPGQRPLTPTGAGPSLNFGLLGHLQGVVDLDLDTEVTAAPTAV